jgi:hypothetical protein
MKYGFTNLSELVLVSDMIKERTVLMVVSLAVTVYRSPLGLDLQSPNLLTFRPLVTKQKHSALRRSSGVAQPIDRG